MLSDCVVGTSGVSVTWNDSGSCCEDVSESSNGICGSAASDSSFGRVLVVSG